MSMMDRTEVLAWCKIAPANESLWADVMYLASRFKADQNRERWHHLLLAVGNFKRDGNRKIYPPSLRSADNLPISTNPILAPEGTTIDPHDARSWPLASTTSGVAVATGTAILAAVWPSLHVIMDYKALASAIALAGLRENDWTLVNDGSNTASVETTWSAYPWYREVVCRTATVCDVPPYQVERALYRLYDHVPAADGPRTWRSFACEMVRVARAAGSVA